ncbi:hypothetical protein FACS1894182_05400 [Bacteroidia bacterium]|nr:hypothetical protein FACS1894182_05400 [Bacteroidia bacterium]
MAELGIISSLISLKKELKSVYKATADEIKYLIDNGLQEYEVNQKNKFEKVKTFLYRSDPVNFYDVFFPINLYGTRAQGKQYEIDVEKEVNTIFKNNNNYVTIIGNAGSGKSMLIKHIFLYFLKQEMEIPLYIELRNLNSFEGSFYEYIIKNIFNNRLSPNDKILERLMSDGKFLFLLDGYDELYNDNKSRRKDEINQFIDKYRKNYFVLTSRPGANIESLPRFVNLNVSSIKQGDIPKFVNKQLFIIEDNKIWENKIMDVINDPQNSDYADYMKNPLLLTMFIFTFKNHPEIPNLKSKFYYNVFDTLCTRHDAFTKDGDIHERKTKLKIEDFEDVLKWFSYFSYFEGKFNFDKNYLVTKLNIIKQKKQYSYDTEDLIYDLTVSLSIIMLDGLDYKFPHRSLQEYFVALLIAQQSESKKINLYKTKYLDKYSDSDYNLWRLSHELDCYNFELFLKNELDRLISMLDALSIQEKISNYLTNTNQEVSLSTTKKVRLWHKYDNDIMKVYTYCNRNNNENRIPEPVFKMYTYSDSLKLLIETDPWLRNAIDYSHPNYNPVDELEVMPPNKYIIRCPHQIVIVQRGEVNIHLYSYYAEIGLDVFVNNLIDDIKRARNQLVRSIETKRKSNEELFNL